MGPEALRAFDGSVAIVTGGASGIGQALGEALAERGATAILADRQGERLAEVVAGIVERGGRAEAHTVDVTDRGAVEGLVAQVFSRHGRLDYLFNNAGIGIGGEARYYQPGDWDRVIDVNLRGVAHGIEAALPRLLDQGFGHIVNTASMAGLSPFPNMVAYSATKHAVVGLSKSLRVEVARFGVRVSVLCPGVIRTPILFGGRYGAIRQQTPEGLLERQLERLGPMEPRPFAEQVLRKVARNPAVIIVPGRWRLAWWLDRLAPGLVMAIARRLHERLQRQIAEVVPRS